MGSTSHSNTSIIFDFPPFQPKPILPSLSPGAMRGRAVGLVQGAGVLDVGELGLSVAVDGGAVGQGWVGVVDSSLGGLEVPA